VLQNPSTFRTEANEGNEATILWVTKEGSVQYLGCLAHSLGGKNGRPLLLRGVFGAAPGSATIVLGKLNVARQEP
jgi:hypothetical protein